jgi:HK97 family phage portal protein
MKVGKMETSSCSFEAGETYAVAPYDVAASVTALATKSGNDNTISAGYVNVVSNDPLAFTGGYGGYDGVGTATINEYSCLQIPAVWRAISWLSSALAGLPDQIYSKDKDTRKREFGHPMDFILNDEASDLCTSLAFKESLFFAAFVCGNGYALIERGTGGKVTALYNLPSDRVTPYRVDGQQWYAIKVDGQNKPIPVPGNLILHIHGLGSDGQQGYPVIQVLAQALSVGKSAQAYGAKWFQQGGMLGPVLETDRTLTGEQIDSLRSQMNERHTGLSNAHKFMILQGGTKAKNMGESPENSQLIETIRASNLDVCKIFGVEPFVIYDYKDANNNSLEVMNTLAVQNSLMPWVLRFEAEVNRKCFTTKERRKQGFFLSLNVDALVRGDHTTSITSAAKRIDAGLSTPDEERALMDMAPYPNGIGAIPRVSANTVPLDPALTPPPAPPRPNNNAKKALPEPVEPPATATEPKAEPKPGVNLATFGSLFSDVAKRVGTKTTMATEQALKKHKDNPTSWTAWANVFSGQAGGFATAAITPVLATYAVASGHPLVVDELATKIGTRYGTALKGHLYRLSKGETTMEPDLNATITNLMNEVGENV